MNIGKIIRKRRRLLDITQTELAEKIKTSHTNISFWELGKTNLKAIDFLRIIRILDLKLEDFNECK